MNEENFKEMSNKCDALCIKKNKDYGDSNIIDLGPKGLFPRIYDKVQRLKTLLWDEKQRGVIEETVKDTAMDLRNYAQILVLLLEHKFK